MRLADRLVTLAPQTPFLPTLAAWWTERADGDPLRMADGLFLLPTRRAARALHDAFTAQLDPAGGALMLPRIAALGGLDEAPLEIAGAIDLPPAVERQVRLAHLSRLVMAMDGKYGAPSTLDRVWPLAVELAGLIDEAHRSEVDLHAALPGAAAENFAEHWARTLEFLGIVTAAWPAWLAENGRMDPAERSVRLLDAQREAWAETPPGHPVVIAGTTAGIPAVARLVGQVARMEGGLVVLPGLDHAMEDAAWDLLGDPAQAGHPQAGMKRLLDGLGATRGDVRDWEAALPSGIAPARAETLARAMLPAQALGAWRLPGLDDVSGLHRLDAPDSQAEATAIALALRDQLEQPGTTAALVTPDRALAVRVTAELARYDVVADDSAGERLLDSPPGAFLRLLAVAADQELRPVALLSLLKHPMAGFGLPLAACRDAARTLERAVLRGPAPPPGLAGLRGALARAGQDRREAASDLLDRLEARLGGLLAVLRRPALPGALLEALVRAAEAAADTPEEEGAVRLWSGEEGEALSTLLAGLVAALDVIPAQPPGILPGLLNGALQGEVVRSRRALRGREGTEHPRVHIWGLLEARLQRADLIVLGGLVEGTWPPGTDPGPWMSRPMRHAVGLPSAEDRIGQMAHDFLMAACAAPEVVLSAPRRRDSAPAVPARWLVRLEAYLSGRPQRLLVPTHKAAGWAALLDQPAGPPSPVRAPEPRPPLARRPRKLSVTEIETWQRDPYGIYARHVLRLRALEPLEPSLDQSDFGSVVHAAFHHWLAPYRDGVLPADAAPRLRRAMDDAVAEAGIRPALAAWWRPRLHRIADWAAAQELARRDGTRMPHVLTEASGRWTVPGITPPFVLTGRADRIEHLPCGGIAILDYKTGSVPDLRTVGTGLAPQLPLEAAMAADGAFGDEVAGLVAELTYWRLTGGTKPGETTSVTADGDLAGLVQAARDGLAGLIRAFDDPGRAYLAQPRPDDAPRWNDYAQLARVPEWALAEGGE